MMARKSRKNQGVIRSLPIFLLLMVHGAASLQADEQPSTLPVTWFDDAELADVQFVDEHNGWAVGDRGVIWHTENGGRTWEKQSSGVLCRLDSLSFIDAQHGWAVGGVVRPRTLRSAGVVIRTSDGGQTWNRIDTLMLPALCRVKFIDTLHGWAVGESSALYPSGIFRSDNGGRNWNPVSGSAGAVWNSGDFLNRNAGIVVGKLGLVSTIAGGRIETGRIALRTLPSARSVRLLENGRALLVGEGGMLRTSGDRGETWQTIDTLPLPPEDAPFDFSAIAAVGQEAWVAGTPGTSILHSSDHGRSWESFSTGQSLPLLGLSFVDEKRGWAVGALGTILSTEDGGRSWSVQRRGGSRAAILVVVSEPEYIPMEFLAKACAADGYRSAVYLLHRRDIEQPTPYVSDIRHRLRDSVSIAGGISADIDWRFPLRQTGLDLSEESLLASWNLDRAPSPNRMLVDAVARQIRMWRPEVVLTREPSADDPPSVRIAYDAVLAAVERAAQPRSNSTAMAAWQVQRVAAVQGNTDQRALQLSTATMVPSLATSVEGLTSAALRSIDPNLSLRPLTTSCRIVWERTNSNRSTGDLMGRIDLPSGSEARRGETPSRFISIEHIRQELNLRQQVREWVTQSESIAVDEAWLDTIKEQSVGLNEHAAGWLMAHIAEGLTRAGNVPLAAQANELLIADYPQHPATDAALLRLMHYYGSQEVAWHLANQAPALSPADRHDRLLAIFEQLETKHPSLFAEPQVRFILSAAYRREGSSDKALSFPQSLLATPSDRAWKSVARTELRFDSEVGAPPKPSLTLLTTTERPHLDGQLDEPCWQQGARAILRDPTGGDSPWPAVVMLARDEEYLYIAAICDRAEPMLIEEGAGRPPRPRDGDLSQHDRIEILIDIDRDWATYWKLVIDDRGWTNDRVGEDRSWDPPWFVATQETRDQWTLEAAFPLTELGDESVSDSPWALGIQRIVPGIGFQSWTQPAAITPRPEGFGLLNLQ